MCGRTACTLCRADIQHATQQYSENNDIPKWVERYPWQTYVPSYNISPTNTIPVLVKEHLLEIDETTESFVIFPMRWGLIPYWFKGSSANEFSGSHNCRSETILKRPTFRGPMLKGSRCVIIADGYYEWKDCGKAGKVPYFIYLPNENGIQMDERTFLDEKFCSENNVWKGPRLLTMAGIFDMWKSPEGITIFSCSVLTTESSSSVVHIHNRMPVILDGTDAVKSWMDSKKVTAEEAISNVKQVEKLNFHQVRNFVNDARNNTVECIKPVNTGRNNVKCSQGRSVQVKLDCLFENMRNKKMKLDKGLESNQSTN